MRTESPDTRRLNDASLVRLHLKIVVRLWLKVMLQILLDHVFGHLPYRGTKIPARPKMPTPVPFLHVRKFFKQLARCATLESPHDLARRHRRRTTHQNMHVILAYNSLHYPNLKKLARLSHQLSNSLRYRSSLYFVTVLRHPHKVILNLIHRMTAISVFHATPPVQPILAAKADRLKPVV